MKLDRRTVLAGTAAAFAAPLLSAYPARADAKRQALVDSSLESARKILTGKDYPDAAKYIQGARGAPLANKVPRPPARPKIRPPCTSSGTIKTPRAPSMYLAASG